MSFPSVPNISKSQIKKAEKVLTNKEATSEKVEKAINITSRWRTCHAYPLDTFRSTLKRKLERGSYQESFATQRLKRMPTIIDKLIRSCNGAYYTSIF